MPSVEINFWAVLVAAIVNMAVGYVWYSRWLFAGAWAKATGKNMEDMSGGGTGYVVTIIAALIQAYILAHFVQYTDAVTPGEGLATGFWLWLGFVATTHAVNYVFEGRPLKLFNLNQGYFLLTLLINGALLAVWQ
jgi:hypothetical protein